jgi:hypothetical protein
MVVLLKANVAESTLLLSSRIYTLLDACDAGWQEDAIPAIQREEESVEKWCI